MVTHFTPKTTKKVLFYYANLEKELIRTSAKAKFPSKSLGFMGQLKLEENLYLFFCALSVCGFYTVSRLRRGVGFNPKLIANVNQ